MNSREYWARRAAYEMYREMEIAERAAGDISALLARSAYFLMSNADGVFDALTHDTGLTDAEARTYLAGLSAGDISTLQAIAQQIKDPERRARFIRWLKAHEHTLYSVLALRDQVDQMTPILYAAQATIIEACIARVIRRAYYRKAFEIQRQTGIAYRVGPMDAKRIEKIMRTPWLGSNYSSRLWTHTQALADRVKQEIVISWITGKSEYDSWKAIQAEFGHSSSDVHRLIRTESAHAANEAQKDSYQDAGIDKYIYVATLDMKTSKMCRDLDGTVHDLATATPGKDYPPMHPWCRSTTIAYIPPSMLAKMKRIARDPVTGKNYKIPANITYREWHAKYVEAGNENQSS